MVMTKRKIPLQKNEVLHLQFLQYIWTNPQFPADLFTFTEEILNVKLHFLCSVRRKLQYTNKEKNMGKDTCYILP